MSSGNRWARLAYPLVLLLAATLIAVLDPPAAAADGVRVSAQREPRVAGDFAKGTKMSPEPTGKPWRAKAPVWPKPAQVELELPVRQARAAGAAPSTRAGDLPVWLDGIDDGDESLRRVRVHQLGRDQMTLRISRADGMTAAAPARVMVDAGSFRGAYGGDWLGRLRLWQLTEGCLTAAAKDCRATPLPSRVDQGDATVTAAVDVAGSAGGTLIALAADQKSSTGDWKETSLSPSATWGVSGNTGGFSWKYALRVPPSLGGPAPDITFSYSSASVDGRMASGNNQPSWLGEGFDWHPGFIERRYVDCANRSGDLCWKTDNAFLSMPGHASELIKGPGDRWHLRKDDGTRIERRTGADNGARNGEWWVVTTTDGTQYWFGGRTNSRATLTVPVFDTPGNDGCRAGALDGSACTQAYRWQLDHVVDVHGNTMRLTYAKETNRYGRNGNPNSTVSYDRAGYLEFIEYGTRHDSTAQAPMRVDFAVADRCVAADCANPANWPDVPRDLECTGTPCGVAQVSPSFWTRKRLASVTTKVWDGDRNAYDDIERWTFTHGFPDPSDSVDPVMWLARISHSGRAGFGSPSVDLPDVTFSGVYLPNRVDTSGDQYAAMNRFRLKQVTSETGSVTDVVYTGEVGQPVHPQRCAASGPKPNPDALHENGLLCYPVKWTPPGHTEPIDDFFHKYLVTDVHETDSTGSSPRVVTHYAYEGAPAWHYTDEDGLVKPEFKTWSVWRGYSSVLTTVGDAGEQTRTRTHYFRGMHGDKAPSGTGTATLPAVVVRHHTGDRTLAAATNDEDEYAGMVRARTTYNGTEEVSATAVVPWRSAPTASRTVDGVTVHARFTGEGERHTSTTLDGNRPPRLTKVVTTFDEAYGVPSTVDDHGDTAKSGDEKCVMTDYNRNTGTWLVDRVSRQRTFAVDCAKAASSTLDEADVIGEVRTSYDQAPEWKDAPAPTRGLASKVETLKVFDNDEDNRTFVTEREAKYDAYGRVIESVDVRGAKTTHAYTHTPEGPVTEKTETNDFGWVTTTTLAPAWGLPTRTVDPNGRVSEFAYDALGRLTSVWLPGRNRGTPTHENNPTIRYEYAVRNNDQGTVVTTHRLVAPAPRQTADRYVTTHTIFDGLLRARQTQSRDGAGSDNAVVTDIFYDSAGRVKRTFNPYVADKAMSNVLFRPSTTIPSATTTTYDGAGRVTVKAERRGVAPASPGGGSLIRETRYGYGGDRVDTTPPTGGIVTSSVSDAAGRVVELRQYETGRAAGDSTGYDRTTYVYNAKDQLARVTDAGGAVWSYEYNLRGLVSKATDPDQGVTTSTYFDSGDLETQTDNKSQTVMYSYDKLGRRRTLRDAPVADGELGQLRAEWTYDASGAKGQLSKSIRYVTTGDVTQTYEKNVIGYDTGYRPTRVDYVIPAAENLGSTTFRHEMTFHPQNGSPATTTIPAAGGLPLETLTHEYDSLGRPSNLKTSLGGTYVTGAALGTDPNAVPGTEYTSFSELAILHLQNNNGRLVHIKREYFEDTRRLKQIWTTHQDLNGNGTANVSDVYYGYDLAGNVTSIDDLTSGDYQCFRLDHQQRLTDAWTPATKDTCRTTAPESAVLGGPAKYRHSYGYDQASNRTTMTEYGTPAGNRTTTYTIAAGTHQITGTSTVDNSGIPRVATYRHDELGNVSSRPAIGGDQSLSWDRERRLAATEDATGKTSYVYDADGNRLVRRDPGGTTLYLPGQEIRLTTSGSTTATRYYRHVGQTIATRTKEGGVTWLAGDHHGTTQATVKAGGDTAAVAIRRQTPFGEQRGSSGTWPTSMDKGFVGGTKDPSGLTHLGAREYDPALGRFLSVDPVIDLANPQQINGYHYGNQNPVTLSDPDGLIPRSCPDGECRGGAYGNSAGPATTYNPPVRHTPAPQPRNTNRANCPDGERSCSIANGSTKKRPPNFKEIFKPRRYYVDRNAETHQILEICGMTEIPGVSQGCDLSDALLYAEEGNWGESFLSALGVVPTVSWIRKGARTLSDVSKRAARSNTREVIGENLTGDVTGNLVMRGGSLTGDVHGTVVLTNGAVIRGNIHGNVIMLGGRVEGRVHGQVVQARSLDGGVYVGGQKIFDSYHPPAGTTVINEIVGPK